MTIANRIIRFGTQRADQFLANPANPRVHPQFQRDVMREALNTLGWLAPVIVNQDGYLIDGHERVMQALVNNDEVPFVEVNLDDEEAALALATFDPVGDLARYDAAALQKLLGEVSNAGDQTQAMLNRVLERAYVSIDSPQSLAEIESDYGETDPSHFWPVIRIQVPPDTHKQFYRLLHTMPGDTEVEQLDALIHKYEVVSESG